MSLLFIFVLIFFPVVAIAGLKRLLGELKKTVKS